MKRCPLVLAFMCATAGAMLSLFVQKYATARSAETRRVMLEVCAHPKMKCDSPQKTFAPYELPLRLPTSLRANVPYTSVSFYAVVLRTKSSGSSSDCDEYTRALEVERRQVQALFPRQKVFADHQCPDMGAVGYRVNGQPNTKTLLAVYGGKTQRSAEQALKVVRRRYSKAVIRQMQVSFERIVQ
jgi:hypothetical protein